MTAVFHPSDGRPIRFHLRHGLCYGPILRKEKKRSGVESPTLEADVSCNKSGFAAYPKKFFGGPCEGGEGKLPGFY